MMVVPCMHDLCVKCFDLMKTNNCPICRRTLQKLITVPKICNIFLGEHTDKNTFDNGGYLSIKLIFIPSYNNHTHFIFRGITYHDNSEKKDEFISIILNLIDEEYAFVTPNIKQLNKWADSVMIRDIIYQLNMIEIDEKIDKQTE